MDQEYVQGLRDAKALLDEGVFTQEEFDREKQTLLAQRNERAAEKARVGLLSAAGGKRRREDGKGVKDARAASKWAKYRKKCIHNKDTYECRACGGKRMCEHNKRRTRCPECSGTSSQNAGGAAGGANPAAAAPTGQTQPPPPPPVTSAPAPSPAGGSVGKGEAAKG